MVLYNQQIAVFRFEGSESIGAGHAIRCTVLAETLAANGWQSVIVTSPQTYEFIKALTKFNRIDVDEFYKNPFNHDLLVVDHYDLDYSYENYFRRYAKKILVIDDLANRKHDCDILVDQTYGRNAEDYKKLAPQHCKILAGSDYVLLRSEFIKLRHKALEKRRNTKTVNRILISMGGSDPNNYTLTALKLIKESGFTGIVDVVLGFSENNLVLVKQYIKQSKFNTVNIYVNATNMAELIYEADLAIGAAGSSVWERCYLGLASVLMVTAPNQELIYKNLINSKLCYPTTMLPDLIKEINKIYTKEEFYSKFSYSGITKIQKLLES